ncbi:hypothetical protein ABIB35_000567 [Arthrobacter sp. UYP6]|uniref:hypothetical protein n=1 Tax=Arthrobacter sp. UYP6 TaxID=1756378 RepID=UPI003392CF85
MSPRVQAVLPYVIWLLVVISTVAWRMGVYYEGGADSVVLAKGVCLAVSCLMALALASSVPSNRRIAGRPFLLLVLFISISLIGSVAVGDVPSSLVLAARLILVAATVGFLLMASPGLSGLTPLLVAMAIVGLGSAMTGLPGFLNGQRLTGVLPPLRPNAIAMLCGVPAIAAAHTILRGRGTLALALSLFTLIGVVLATESRTALMGLGLGAVFLLAPLRRVSRSVAVGLLALVLAILPALLYTPALMNMVMRPGSAPLLTLNSRTLAWETVLKTPVQTWERWVGGGLPIKTVSVEGQYWETQVLDSSWMSSLAQAGVLGTVVLATWAVLLLLRTLRTASNTALPAILIFVLLRSFLENGLTEASTTFLLFFAISLMVWEPQARPGTGRDAASAPGLTRSSPAVPQLVKAPR